jgi:molecular chaperone HtpG
MTTHGKVTIRLLETLTSALYDEPIIIFREYVQNAVDSFLESSKKNDKVINITINKQNKQIIIEDNGDAIPSAIFENTMLGIGESQKYKNNALTGFRGIGRLSGMPLCTQLQFINKPKGLTKELICTWNGNKYQELLKQDPNAYLAEILELDKKKSKEEDKIITFTEGKEQKDANTHYFKVILNNYGEEISTLLLDNNFKNKLSLLLPVDYNTTFTSTIEEFKKKYEEFIDEEFTKYIFSIKLNGDDIFKPYTAKLDTPIFYKEIYLESSKKDNQKVKVGIMWFSFNKLVTATNGNHGIVVRKNNFLVSGEDYFAEITERGNEYISTYRELAQTIRGVVGEMLIRIKDTENDLLADNARRDWFKMNNAELQLRAMVIEFTKQLYEYRYAASRFASDKNNTKSKEERFENAFKNLTNKTFSPNLLKIERKQQPKQEEEIIDDFENDILDSTDSVRNFYVKLMTIIKKFFKSNRNLQIFYKLRAYIKKGINNDEQESK